MSVNNTSDIDELIKELEHYQLNMNDRSLGSGFWDKAVKDFISRHSGHLVSLLEELARTRGKTLVNLPASGLHRVVVDGDSNESPAKALSAALNKALLYLSDLHDIILILREISEPPKGGYHAKIEIHIAPPASKEASPSEEEKYLKHIHDHGYGNKAEGSYTKYPVFDHFVGTDDDGQDDLSEYILVNVGDSDLMNYMIEKGFFNSSHISPPLPTAGTPPPKQMMVRVRRHRMELAS